MGSLTNLVVEIRRTGDGGDARVLSGEIGRTGPSRFSRPSRVSRQPHHNGGAFEAVKGVV